MPLSALSEVENGSELGNNLENGKVDAVPKLMGLVKLVHSFSIIIDGDNFLVTSL